MPVTLTRCTRNIKPPNRRLLVTTVSFITISIMLYTCIQNQPGSGSCKLLPECAENTRDHCWTLKATGRRLSRTNEASGQVKLSRTSEAFFVSYSPISLRLSYNSRHTRASNVIFSTFCAPPFAHAQCRKLRKSQKCASDKKSHPLPRVAGFCMYYTRNNVVKLISFLSMRRFLQYGTACTLTVRATVCVSG